VTDGFDQALVAAGLTLLAADSSLTVHAGHVPNGASTPYVLVYSTVEWPDNGEANALDGLSRTAVARWYCHCVGETESAARAVGQRVRTQLLNQRPVVAGMTTGLIRQDGTPPPPQRDEASGIPVFDAIGTYWLLATPA
jgi:hypothetical protein